MKTLLGSVRSPAGVVLGLVAVGLWLFAAWIFLPSLGLLPEVQWSEVASYSPRWSDLLNADLGGGGIWSGVYDDHFAGRHQGGERELGFTPLLAGALAVASAVSIRRLTAGDGSNPWPADDAPNPERGSTRRGAVARSAHLRVLSCSLTVVVLAILFVVDERENGLFAPIWSSVPVFESIRAPFRVQILLYPMAIYAVLQMVEALGLRGSTPRRSAVAVTLGSIVLGGMFLVEMHRPARGGWTRSDLLPAPLAALVDDVERADCDVLMVDESGTSPVEPPQIIDGTVMSMMSGTPTVNGYGRAAPADHPGWHASPVDLVTWLRAHGVDGPICIVSWGGQQPPAAGQRPDGLAVDR